MLLSDHHQVVFILSDKKQKRKPAANLSTSDDPDLKTKKQIKLPLFVFHFKHTSDPDSPR